MTSTACFDPGLISRYGGEGPRYTSYPTARQFHEGLAADVYESAVRSSPATRTRAPLSAYIHTPFCASPCLYCACNRIITQRVERIDAYVGRLLREIRLRGTYFERSRFIDQLHIGGGTPSYLSGQCLKSIIDELDHTFGLTWNDSRDYSIELDPRGTDADQLRLLGDLGFNRLSFGVQDFDHAVQLAINRVQPVEMVAAVYGHARRIGFQSINFDLIYGLPKQSPATFETTLRHVIQLRPDRLAVYGYAHMPTLFKAQRQILSADLPGAGTRIALLQLAIERLTDAGYVYIGMDHFALPEDALSRAKAAGTLHRSFQGYTTHAERDLVAMGVSAIGRIGDMYLQNHKSLKGYYACLDRGVLPTQRGVQSSPADVLRGEIIQQLMCRSYIDLAAINEKYALSFVDRFAPEMQRLRTMADDGLLQISDARITLTSTGRYLVRNVAMVFDEYLRIGTQLLPLSKVV